MAVGDDLSHAFAVAHTQQNPYDYYGVLSEAESAKKDELLKSELEHLKRLAMVEDKETPYELCYPEEDLQQELIFQYAKKHEAEEEYRNVMKF